MYYLCVHVCDDYNFMDCFQVRRINKWWKIMVMRGSRKIFFFEYTLSNVNFQIPWNLILDIYYVDISPMLELALLRVNNLPQCSNSKSLMIWDFCVDFSVHLTVSGINACVVCVSSWSHRTEQLHSKSFPDNPLKIWVTFSIGHHFWNYIVIV